MAYQFLSDAWIKQLMDELNSNQDYKRSAKDWEGDFIFVIKPDQDLDEEVYYYLGLHHGEATGGGRLEAMEEKETEFVVRAPYGTWRRVIDGNLDPIQGMLTNQLKLKGDLMMVMRYPKAAQEIVASCAKIPTEWE